MLTLFIKSAEEGGKANNLNLVKTTTTTPHSYWSMYSADSSTNSNSTLNRERQGLTSMHTKNNKKSGVPPEQVTRLYTYIST